MARFQGIPVEPEETEVQQSKPRFAGVPVDQAEEAEKPEKDYNWQGLIRQGLQGLTFGTSDEIGAGIATVPAAIATGNYNLPEIYGDIHQSLQDERSQFKEENPYSALAAELTGGLATGGVGAGKLLAMKGISSLRPMAQAATVGGIEGGAYGFLSGDRGKRLESAGIGAVGGAVGAPVAQGLAKVATGVAAPVAQWAKKRIVGTPSSDAQEFLAESLAREGVKSVQSVAKTPKGTFTTLADVTESGRGILEGVVNDIENPGIRKLVKDTLQVRNKQMQSRLFDSIDEGLGVGGTNYRDVVQGIKAVRSEKARPLYEEARAKPVQMTDYMKAVFDPERGVPEVKTALQEATQRVASKRAAGDQVAHIDVIDEMKRALDDDIKALMRQGKNNRARDLIRVKNKILEDVDKQIPEYKAARNAYAGESELLDAAEEGTKILRADVDYLDDTLKNMTESEKHMFRVGAKKAIREKLMQSREGTNAINRIASEMNLDRIRRAFPSEKEFKKFRQNIRLEADIFETERVLHNSMTALRQAAQKRMDQGELGQMIDEAGGGMSGMATNAIKRLLSSGLSAEAKEELGVLVLQPIQQMPPDIVQKINRTILKQMPDARKDEILKLLESARRASMAAPGIAATSDD